MKPPRTPKTPTDPEALRDLRDLLALGWERDRIRKALRISRATLYRRIAELDALKARHPRLMLVGA